MIKSMEKQSKERVKINEALQENFGEKDSSAKVQKGGERYGDYKRYKAERPDQYISMA